MYEFYGDEWLMLDDLMDQGTPQEKVGRAMGLGIEVNQKQLDYISGGKQGLIRQIAFLNGVNRVLNTDKEKYEKIWTGKDPKYPEKRKIRLIFLNNGELEGMKSNEAKHSYIA